MGTLVLGQTGVSGQTRGADKAAAPAGKTPGFWSRLFASFVKSRQRAADREIARHLARNPQAARLVREHGETVWKQAADALPF